MKERLRFLLRTLEILETPQNGEADRAPFAEQQFGGSGNY